MLLTGERGRALTVDYFRHIIIDGSKEVEGLNSGMENAGTTTHGLRFTAATRLRELGLSWDVIASITGHDTAAMVEHYTEQKRKAEMAIDTLNAATAAQNSNKSVKPVPAKCKTGEPPVLPHSDFLNRHDD